MLVNNTKILLPRNNDTDLEIGSNAREIHKYLDPKRS
jgi:hypothetical protein